MKTAKFYTMQKFPAIQNIEWEKVDEGNDNAYMPEGNDFGHNKINSDSAHITFKSIILYFIVYRDRIIFS